MINFKEYFTKKFNFLKEDYTIGELTNSKSSSFIFNDGFSKITNALKKLSNAQRGDLIGECINIFRDTKNKKVEVHIPGPNGLAYQISKITADNKIKDKNPHGREAIVISETFINEFFKQKKVDTAIKNIIDDVHNGHGESEEYRFGSAADPTPRKITKDMINKRETTEDAKEWSTSKDSYQRLIKVKRKTGEFKEIKSLTLKTTQTGRGMNKSKRGSLMDVGRGGRKTNSIENYYYLNSSANYCVEIGNADAYAICIKRDNNDLSNKSNQSQGTINNVYFIKKSAMNDVSSDLSLFLSTEFLEHLAVTLSLKTNEPIQIDSHSNRNNNIKKPSSDFKPFIGVPQELRDINPSGYQLLLKIANNYKVKYRGSRNIVLPRAIYNDIKAKYPSVIEKLKDLEEELYEYDSK
jgi:hypothetical protein